MKESIRILVMGTSGVMNDGITSWMQQTFGSMDLTGIELTTIAFNGCDSSIISRVQDVGFKVVTVPSRKTDPLAYASAYRSLLDRGHFSVVHICCNSALATFELSEARKSAVGMRVAHSHNTTCGHRLMDKLLRPAFYRVATDYYACGTAAGEWLFEHRPFTVIPNGKRIEEFVFSATARSEARISLGFDDNAIVIGHVGRFNQQKNHSKLLDIFAELYSRSDRYRLVLVGDGALVDATKRKAESLGISDAILFLGLRTDVPFLLNAMDCVVFPSLYEGFPNVVLEWQLNGLPVVMSDTITDECVLSSLVSQLPLGASPVDWANAVEHSRDERNRAKDCLTACDAAKAAGYDIRENASTLRHLYFEGVARCS